MADCFWTDFVACEEDCGGAPPAMGELDMSPHGYGAGQFTLSIPDVTSPVIVVNKATVYLVPSDVTAGYYQNCDWMTYLLSTHGEANDTDGPDSSANGGGTATYKDLAFFTAAGAGVYTADGMSLVATANEITIDQLTDALGAPGAAAGVWALEVTDTNTGLKYSGSAPMTYCY